MIYEKTILIGVIVAIVRNGLEIIRKNLILAGSICLFALLIFTLLTILISGYFVFFVIVISASVCSFIYNMYMEEHSRLEDFSLQIEEMKSSLSDRQFTLSTLSGSEDKYNSLLKHSRKFRESVLQIEGQMKDFISLKQSSMEKILNNQKDLISNNSKILSEIQRESSTFSAETNIVKDLITNIAEKVDSEIDFSRHSLDRLTTLFNVIADIIKTSGVLYRNSEFLVSIMQTIENISNKIHVLSINASVIAARSGEAGKSFMVVAKEVRNLSDNVKHSVDEMKSNSDKLRSSIEEVTTNIRQIETETKTTYEDMENLLMRFEGLNLAINIIDKKIISNMDIIKNFDNLIRENLKNNNEYSSLMDSFNLNGLDNAIDLAEQADKQFIIPGNGDTEK